MSDSRLLEKQAARLRFAPPLETQFRDDYFDNSLPLARAALGALLLMWVAFGILDTYALPISLPKVWFLRYAVVFPLWIAVLAWSFLPSFRGAMQIAISLLLFIGGSALSVMTAIAKPSELGYLLYYSGLILAPLCGYSFLRLRFVYATAANFATLVGYIALALGYQKILSQPQGATILFNNLFFVIGANIAGMATCYSLEFSSRRAFVATYLLEQDRLGEQRKRERTEAMLRVFNQAIGGVVHDLGNPLTSIQLGAQTLEMLLENPQIDRESAFEVLGFIGNGAEMLGSLRLSLMEQTRVLEGQPTPVDLQPTPLRAALETALRHQNPRYRGSREITLDGPPCQVRADAAKLGTAFVNLIGNALKYSDGEVRIVWRIEGDFALISVADRGQNGRGLSLEQAQKLFVAFGRLETHHKIEGTGLGLLSVRHILSAHSGEVFIEGTLDGTPETAPYSTSHAAFAATLPAGFATAFVLSCPLAPRATP